MSSINNRRTKCEFTGNVMKMGVLDKMLGWSFNGSDEVIKIFPNVLPEVSLNINNMSISLSSRDYPQAMSQTGMSTIDTMNSITHSKKIPLFSVGLPHKEVAAQITCQASLVQFKDP